MKSEIRHAALLAVALTMTSGGQSFGQETIQNATVFCKTVITPSGEMGGETILSVELPPTPGFTDPDGNPVTIWNVGDVPQGGVADTFHAGGPGFFTVRNTGNVSAFVYITGMSRAEFDASSLYWSVFYHLFNADPYFLYPRPEPRTEEFYGYETYHLALTTDVTAIAPTWRSLDHVSWFGPAHINYEDNRYEAQCSAYLAWMPPGEYQPFDLKFWAPMPGRPFDMMHGFVFRVEAAAFPRWEHDR